MPDVVIINQLLNNKLIIIKALMLYTNKLINNWMKLNMKIDVNWLIITETHREDNPWKRNIKIITENTIELIACQLNKCLLNIKIHIRNNWYYIWGLR